MLRHVPLIPYLSNTFVLKGCWVSTSNELCSYFSVVYMVNYTDRPFYAEPSLHLWDEVYLIMVDDLFDVFLDSVCQCFIIFESMFMREISV